MASQRIEYLDAVKGFAIFLVVFAHAIGWNISDIESILDPDYHQSIDSAAKGLVWSIIYSFHMPLFFMVSGYFLASINYGMSKAEKIIKLKKQVFNKNKKLLLPYFITGFLMLLWHGYYGYWFLFSLWEVSLLSLLMVFLMSFSKKSQKIWFDVLCWGAFYLILRIILPRLPHYDWVEFDRCLFSLPAFICGIFMRKYDLLKYITTKKCYAAVGGFILTFSLAYLPYLYPDSIYAHKFSVGLRLYIIPLFGCVAVIGFFKLLSVRLTNIKKGGYATFFNMMKYLGLFTLEIYIFHIFFVIRMPAIGDWIASLHPAALFPLQIVYASVLAAIAILLSVLIAKLTVRIPGVSLLMFGKDKASCHS